MASRVTSPLKFTEAVGTPLTRTSWGGVKLLTFTVIGRLPARVTTAWLVEVLQEMEEILAVPRGPSVLSVVVSALARAGKPVEGLTPLELEPKPRAAAVM